MAGGMENRNNSVSGEKGEGDRRVQKITIMSTSEKVYAEVLRERLEKDVESKLTNIIDIIMKEYYGER